MVARAWRLPFVGLAPCLHVCKLWHLADRQGSLARAYAIYIDYYYFAAVFANTGGFKLIVADQLAPVLANLCGFKLIITDQFAVVQQNN